MKHTPLLILAALLACLCACAPEPREAAYSALEWKDDVYFLEGKPFTGIARDAHKDGKPKGEYPFKEGRLHGLVREWWDNGRLSTETNFDSGKRHGLNRYWNLKGQLIKEQVYEHDKSVSEKHYDPK
ncbi:MAG TPA: hypothetical protein PK490_03895 [Prosthecobacter sp.]|nr:hypothetical protein [Prosthecobacter sp.]HRK13405.1 hypothetical protein [Prosthecobacter sp.]